MLGKDAIEVSPFAKPLTFRDPVDVARDMVDVLRNREKADLVICLSHGGLNDDPAKNPKTNCWRVKSKALTLS